MGKGGLKVSLVAIWKNESWGGDRKKWNISYTIYALVPVVDTRSTVIQRWDSDEPKVITIQIISKAVSTDYGVSPTAANVILVIRWGKAPGLKSTCNS